MPNIRHLNRAFNKLRRLLLIFLLSFGSLSAFSQVTTEGREFWLGFMENNDGGTASSLEIFLTSKETAQVEIFLYRDSRTITITVEPGVTHREIIGSAPNNPNAASGSGQLQRKGIYITSDVDISVYALNNRFRSADATVVLPFNTLGNQYYAAAYWEGAPAGDNWDIGSGPAQLLIVAATDNTQIDITPSVTTIDGRAAETTFTITLDQGEVYQVQADADLAGTLIETSTANDPDVCNNFAVFAGNKWGRVTGGADCGSGGNAGGFAADQLYEQMYPTNTWGREYIAVPFELRRAYVLQVTVLEDDTELTIGAAIDTLLGAGDVIYALEEDVVRINANKPIQVAQLSQSLSCDANVNFGPGDPFMIMLSPNEQKLNDITFNALTTEAIDDYFVTVITETSEIANITFNGAVINPVNFTPVAGSTFSVASLGIDKGEDYNLNSEAGFIAYIYGFGNIESFGYVAGASLENLSLDIVGDDPDIAIIAEEGCVNNEIAFTADFEVPAGEAPRFTEFEWNFGDGTIATGKDTVHTYSQPGEYTITLLVSDGGGVCGINSDLKVRTITITPNEITNISGPASVCPDVNGIAYAVEGTPGNTYQWIVDGGTIVGADTGDAISVDWGAARPDASLKLISTNTLGCVADTVTFDVIINKRLEPVLPQSNGFTNTEVCFTELGDVTYSTPQTAGSEYEWFITGGNFITANNTNLVRVSWNGPGAGQIWYREFNPLISDCEGFSDRLDIIIYPEIVSTPTIMDALCNGDANGTISIALAGGKPGYTVAWSNGMTGIDINGLAAGDYTATVTDALGCEVMFTYTVAEPAILEVADNQLTDVRCFQESNGAATILVAGGTVFPNGDYIYNWTGTSGFTQSTNTGTINGLRAGAYQVDIRDANGCETSTTFTINEPLLLEADIASLINDPICPQASDGTAFIDAKGGTPDYQFFWSNNPTLNDPNASGLSKGNYTVRIVDANGCETSLAIEVTERFPRIFIPNAFSPNGDGTNDDFKPVADCSITFSMQVYNKWGSVVFSTEDVNEGWDGQFDNQPAPDGKYSYVIFYAGTLNDVAFEETFRGSIKLIR